MKLWISTYCPPCQNIESISLAALLAQYSPEITMLDSHSIAVHITASLTLFKGPLALSRRIKSALQQTFPAVAMGMAPTAWGAYLLARQANCTGRVARVISQTSMVRHLNRLPIQALPAAQPHLFWLAQLGCSTLAEVMQLPRASLLVRTSSQFVDQLDFAYGYRTPVFSWHQFDENFATVKNLDYHSRNTMILQPVLEEIIKQLCDWLQVKQRAVSELVFLLHYEKTKHPTFYKTLLIRLSQPAWQPNDFLEVLAEKLAALTLEAPVIAIELCSVVGQEKPFRHQQLFPDAQQIQQQQHKLIDLLKARLGNEQILTPIPQESYLPEQANQWRNNQTPTLNPRPIPTNHPFWLLHPPIKLAYSSQGFPVYKGRRLYLLQGPERIESGWWTHHAHQRRDYFIAGDDLQRQYWIYQERRSDQASWFLHGFFA